jgi:flavin reductase (DIM6/NTAB) family NADH-FMN oxidoreductase RutF
MVAISVGHTRYSHELIGQSGEFVLVFPSAAQAEACTICGTKSGRDTDKLAAAALRTAPARLVRPPLLEGAVANLECRVKGRLTTGDHTIFAAEILAAHVDDDAGERVCNFAGRFVAARPRGRDRAVGGEA